MARKRNPMARDLLTNPLYRAKHTKSRVERAHKADRWDRRAKHKLPTKSPEPKPGSGDLFWISSATASPSRATQRVAGR